METLQMRFTMALLAALAASPASVLAADAAITVYGGYRSGGGFTDAYTNEAIDLDASGAFAASLDLAMDASRQLRLFVSRQGSRLAVATPGSPAASLDGRSMAVTYVHVGGTNFFTGPIGPGSYVVGGLGATRFSPAISGFSATWRPSMHVGVGYQLPLSANLALRFEARAYLTLVNSEGGLFCSGGCVVSIRGDSFTQVDAQIGLSMVF
jgi:hypothetical protein